MSTAEQSAAGTPPETQAAGQGQSPSDQSPAFESGLNELERIVKQLEAGDLPLEQSMQLFERGMRLSAECKRQLEEAETRIEILMRKGSGVVAVPFDPEKQGTR